MPRGVKGTGKPRITDPNRPRRADGRAVPLSEEEQERLRFEALREQLVEANRLIEKQTVTFDNMYRRSEDMRNRQIDIINRLLNGATIDEEFQRVLADNASLAVELENTKRHLATRSEELKTALMEIKVLTALKAPVLPPIKETS